jgi:N-acyl-D-aspartate/D-glutamate deacylase
VKVHASSRLRRIVAPSAAAIAALSALLAAQPRFDLIIRGGEIIDGTGAPASRADVAIRGDSIVEVGDLSSAEARRTVNAAGLVVVPGFIDMHSHSDYPSWWMAEPCRR